MELLPEHMIELRAIALEWTGNKSYCSYIIPGDFNRYSKEIKETMALPQYSKGRIAVAVFQSNLAVKIIVDLYWNMTKRQEPTRLFRTKEEALKWLRQKRDENNLLNNKNFNIA